MRTGSLRPGTSTRTWILFRNILRLLSSSIIIASSLAVITEPLEIESLTIGSLVTQSALVFSAIDLSDIFRISFSI